MTKHLRISGTTALRAALVAATLAGTVAVAPAALASTGSATPSAHASTTAHHEAAAGRRLLGTVSGSTYLEASVPADGTYAIEYVTSGGVSFWDTYVDGTELGYVGGAPGTYRTEAIALRAGGHLVQVVGPEGSGTAEVYGVRIS